MSTDEKVRVTPDEAVKRLKVIEDYDPGDGPQPCVHTFATGGGISLGAHWSVEDARAAFEKYGVEGAGPGMAGMGHGLAIVRESGPVFFETIATQRLARVTLKTEIYQTYEVDLDALENWSEGTVNVTSTESVGDMIDSALVDQGDEIKLSWMRDLAGLTEGSREVYEVELGTEPAR